MRIISRQSVAGFIVGVLVCSGIGVGAASLMYYNDKVSVNIDGKQINTKVVFADGKNYTSVRDVAESMGGTVKYDSSTGRIDILTIKPGTVQDVASQADNCVLISCMNSLKPHATASGVLWGTDYILTNKHVLENANKWIANTNKSDTDKFYCTETKTFDDSGIDIALIKTDRPHDNNIKLGDSDKVRVGDPVVVISSPLGNKNVVTNGIVTHITVDNDVYYIWTNAPAIKPGSSGGGMFNMNGELIALMKGSLSAKDDDMNAGIAINNIKKVIG